MAAWNNFYLQKMGSGNPVKESVNSWNIWCKTIPFKIADKVKDPAKRSWYDEHGDDEYIPSTGLYMEAYTMKVEFGCKSTATVVSGVTVAAKTMVRNKIQAFKEYLQSSGMMNMYSKHTLVGRQYVRLESFPESATWKQGEDGYWFLVFEVTFKVNDPTTDITLTA